MPRTVLAGLLPLSLSLLLAAAPRGASAQQVAPSPRPDFMSRVPRLPERIAEQKQEGSYFTAIPAIGVDPDDGFQLGAFAELYDNGSRDDPFFDSTPYRKLTALGAVHGTEGSFRGVVALDRPYIRETPYRLRAVVEAEHRGFENYFGLGSSSLQRLRNPSTGAVFDEIEDYRESLRTISDDSTLAAFNQWESTRLSLRASVERDTLGGVLRPLFGVQVSWVDVQLLDGERVDASGGTAVQGPTLLGLDCASKEIRGCDGGFDNLIKLGIAYDTRDFEPDPRSGVLAELTGELSSEVFGSEFDYRRVTAHSSVYWSPLPERIDVVLAGRAFYNWQSGEVPFYSQPFHAVTTDPADLQGLGGFQTIRGFTRNRFVGKVSAGASAEVRWTFGEGTVLGQHLSYKLAPFVDTGRVFDSVGSTTIRGWEFGYGLGFRLGWELSTVVSFDWAHTREGDAFYMELGHAF